MTCTRWGGGGTEARGARGRERSRLAEVIHQLDSRGKADPLGVAGEALAAGANLPCHAVSLTRGVPGVDAPDEHDDHRAGHDGVQSANHPRRSLQDGMPSTATRNLPWKTRSCCPGAAAPAPANTSLEHAVIVDEILQNGGVRRPGLRAQAPGTNRRTNGPRALYRPGSLVVFHRRSSRKMGFHPFPPCSRGGGRSRAYCESGADSHLLTISDAT